MCVDVCVYAYRTKGGLGCAHLADSVETDARALNLQRRHEAIREEVRASKE